MEIIWKYLCINKKCIYRPFNGATYKETFLKVTQEKCKLKNELNVLISENDMSIEEFQLFVCNSLIDALRPECKVRRMLRDEGTVREPKNSELLVYV